MDGAKYSLSESVMDEKMDANLGWVRAVRESLERILEQDPSAPALDLEWLIKRCDDTARVSKDWQVKSLEQLIKDLAGFDEEFPGLVEKSLLRGPSK